MKIREIEETYRGKTPGIIGDPKGYAVLLPLVELEGEAHILFEVRADGMKHQPGEICFPGGRMEPGETPEACALRETEEELGIPPTAVEIVGQLDAFVDQRRIVRPVLGKVDAAALADLKPNPEEVKQTFLVPAEFFLQTSPRVYRIPLKVDLGEQEREFNEFVGFPQGYPWGKRKMTVPGWQYEDKVIWGLTGRILLWHFRPGDWD